ncbi:adenylyl cyclase [Fomitiporia mediterranea MF3/22]|uniref:adenylyl cyclase n=1 Tax=Fomitiporia mediterranea (strain MF3/22) TaxID=694068 RepID=UPI000440787E|nr:adenylyl cyclase [Fomitiporia mediterranea MF3/22]EJD02691.1 adenylyl cyclase [Fomitiporia mediterranea MF3/22]
MLPTVLASTLIKSTNTIQPALLSTGSNLKLACIIFAAVIGILIRTIIITAPSKQKKVQEVLAPTGHVVLVFTDIRNSTRLWDTNTGMRRAMGLHHQLLRRQLRLCGGYEVKTTGDGFMCSFQNASSAIKWCLTVQLDLLREPWPSEILECEDGKEVFDRHGTLIERGLAVRVGIHCGTPVCEPDPVTRRMDYFGPVVNRAARIAGSANGARHGIRSLGLVTAIEGIDVEIASVGERRLKGLLEPEIPSSVYPKELIGGSELNLTENPDVSLPQNVEEVDFNLTAILDSFSAYIDKVFSLSMVDTP